MMEKAFIEELKNKIDLEAHIKENKKKQAVKIDKYPEHLALWKEKVEYARASKESRDLEHRELANKYITRWKNFSERKASVVKAYLDVRNMQEKAIRNLKTMFVVLNLKRYHAVVMDRINYYKAKRKLQMNLTWRLTFMIIRMKRYGPNLLKRNQNQLRNALTLVPGLA